MSLPDFGKLILIVNNYIKTTEGVIIVWRCQYNEEDTTITSAAIPIEENKKPAFYMRKAFKDCKKQIKQWVKSVHGKPSVIGSQYVFALNEMDEEDEEDEEVV